MTDAWARIFADEKLRRARAKLSAHEILLIVHHAADAERDRIIDWLGEDNITANNIGASLSRNIHRPKPTAEDFRRIADAAIPSIPADGEQK